MAGKKVHVVAVPVPAQGHVKPLMSLCHQIAKHGVKVTIVNAQSIHDKIINSSTAEEEEEEFNDNVVMATVPNGITPGDDPDNPFTLMAALRNTMPENLTDLIERINTSNPNERVSCVIADLSFGWIFDVAEKMGAEPVGFSPPSVACLAVLLRTLKMVEEGSIDANGSLKNRDAISLSEDVPPWRNDELPWRFPGNPETEKFLFDQFLKVYGDVSKAKYRLCNSCYELEPAIIPLLPNIVPIGPLNLLDESGAKSSNLYAEDSSCLSWLDSKPEGSVIYVSFGSTTVFSQQQLDELALGLEQSGRAFLWVVRQDLANGSQAVYPEGFLERVGELGKIVEWVPQNRVLSHPSIACFVSHCGWNSTIEGVSRGVPFLCWSYFADQFHNRRYICNKWEIGLNIDFDEEGIRSRHEIKKKIEMIFSDRKFKENALKLKELCAKSVSDGGSSYTNLEKFIHHLKK